MPNSTDEQQQGENLNISIFISLNTRTRIKSILEIVIFSGLRNDAEISNWLFVNIVI